MARCMDKGTERVYKPAYRVIMQSSIVGLSLLGSVIASCGDGSQSRQSVSADSAISTVDLLRVDDLAIEAWNDATEQRFDQSLEKAERAVKLDGASHRAWYTLGRTLFAERKYEAAAQKFRRAAELDTSCSMCTTGLVTSLAFSGDSRAARQVAVRAAEVPPHTILHSSLSLLARGKDEHRARLRELAAEHPREPMVYLLIAGVEELAGDSAAALDAATKAIELDPQFGLAYATRSLLRDENTDRGAVRDDLGRALAAGATYPAVLANRGRIENQMRPGDGLEDTQRAIAMYGPDHAPSGVHVSLAAISYARGDLSTAKRALLDAAVRHGNSGFFYPTDTQESFLSWIAAARSHGERDDVHWYFLAVAAHFEQQNMEGKKFAAKVVELDSSWPLAWFVLGHFQDYLGDTKLAAESFLRAARAEPRFGFAWTRAADALRRCGDLKGADDACLQLGRHCPDWAIGLGFLAERDLENERYDAAIRKATRSLAGKWSADVLYVRSQARRALRDRDGELRDLQLSVGASPTPRALLARGRYWLEANQSEAGLKDLFAAHAQAGPDSAIGRQASALIAPYFDACSSCGGAGGRTESRYVTCGFCGGSGSIGLGSQGVGAAALQTRNQCSSCTGGRRWENVFVECDACGGSGQVRKR